MKKVLLACGIGLVAVLSQPARALVYKAGLPTQVMVLVRQEMQISVSANECEIPEPDINPTYGSHGVGAIEPYCIIDLGALKLPSGGKIIDASFPAQSSLYGEFLSNSNRLYIRPNRDSGAMDWSTFQRLIEKGLTVRALYEGPRLP